MGFVVHFTVPRERPVEPASLLAWAREVVGMTVPAAVGGDLRLAYADPATKVRFQLGWVASGLPLPPGTEMPPGSADSGLALSVPFLRPVFHCRQALEVVGGAVARFGLSVLDPGGSGNGHPVRPEAWDPETLVSRYRERNRREVESRRAAARKPLPLVLGQYLPEPQAEAWWRWRRMLPALQREFGRALSLPTMLLVKPRDSARVRTAVTWPDSRPIVLPLVDDVFLLRGVREGAAEELVAVHGDRVRRELAGLLEDRPGDLPLAILRPERAMEASTWFVSVEGAVRAEDYEQVEPDAFTDVALSTGLA